MAVVTLAEYKDFLQIPNDDKSRDFQISRVSVEVEDFFEGYTGRRLSPVDIVKLMDGSGTDVLVFPFKPISAITKVETVSAGVASLVTGSIDFDPDSARAKFGSTIPAGRLNVKVTYTAGYTNVPPAIKLLLKRLVSFFLDPSTQGAASRKKLGSLEVEVETDCLPAHLKFQLDGYRQIMVG